QLGIRDSFVIGQEPDALRSGNAFTSFQRLSGDNIRNYGAITLNGQLSRLFGIEVGFANVYFNYGQDGELVAEDPNFLPFLVPIVQPSASGVMDRIEHTAHIDGR